LAVKKVADTFSLTPFLLTPFLPHYYSPMVEWSQAFDGAPIYPHSDERSWVMRPEPTIVFWEGGELETGRGLTLLRMGGHFAGALVLHWAAGADGRGVVLAGDIL
jgi:glyoxylase-like metal-dependent hydrolase (beta-lactamase superfamily II)